MWMQVVFVAHEVLPEPVLPDTALAFPQGRHRHMVFPWDAAGECSLDQEPARGEIRIARRQCPDCMQMFWQHDPRNALEGVAIFHPFDRISQQVDVLRQQPPRTIGEIDGEGIGSACDLGSSITHELIVLKHVGVRKLTPTYVRDRKPVECA